MGLIDDIRDYWEWSDNPALFRADELALKEVFKDDVSDPEDKPLKEKDGKPEGARFFYLDILPYLTDYKDTPTEYLCSAFNNFVYARNINKIIELRKVIKALAQTIDLKTLLKNSIEARHAAIVSGKYKAESYHEKFNVADLEDAAARHLIKHVLGEERDEETGCLHLGHFFCNLIMIGGQI